MKKILYTLSVISLLAFWSGACATAHVPLTHDTTITSTSTPDEIPTEKASWLTRFLGIKHIEDFYNEGCVQHGATTKCIFERTLTVPDHTLKQILNEKIAKYNPPKYRKDRIGITQKIERNIDDNITNKDLMILNNRLFDKNISINLREKDIKNFTGLEDLHESRYVK